MQEGSLSPAANTVPQSQSITITTSSTSKTVTTTTTASTTTKTQPNPKGHKLSGVSKNKILRYCLTNKTTVNVRIPDIQLLETFIRKFSVQLL